MITICLPCDLNFILLVFVVTMVKQDNEPWILINRKRYLTQSPVSHHPPR